MTTPSPGLVGGRPTKYWLSLFVLTHYLGEGGWVRLEWPDGENLWRQSWTLAAVFRIITDEWSSMVAERNRRIDRP